MSQKLPISDYEFISNPSSFDFMNIESDGETGYILEVDVEYGKNLHELHNDYPFLPEKVKLNRTEKLCATLNDKKNYIVYIKNLQQAVNNGLKVTGIHRVLKFKQCEWLKSYIDLNTKKRQEATTNTRKDICKLMNNSIYGKSCENVLKRRTIYLFDSWERQGCKKGASSFVSSGYMQRLKVFDDNFIGVELQQKSVKYNKPVQVGFTVLELSKHLMYDFHYSKMLKMFDPKNVKMCYTDTDSFVYHIKTEDFYADLKEIVNDPTQKVFDTSEYPVDNQYGYKLVNKKVLGCFKDELNGVPMQKFVALRAKCYTFIAGDEVKSKAKGVKKYVTKTLTPSEYMQCIRNQNLNIFKNQYVFRSRNHQIYTENIRKVALNGKDDKRFICPDKITTLALGHKDIIHHEIEAMEIDLILDFQSEDISLKLNIKD